MISIGMFDDGDGGSIAVTSNRIVIDESYKTVIYNSLFGGNSIEDILDNVVDYSEFNKLLRTNKSEDWSEVKAVGNIQLQWLIDDEYVTSVKITSIEENSSGVFIIEVLVDGILKFKLQA